MNREQRRTEHGSIIQQRLNTDIARIHIFRRQPEGAHQDKSPIILLGGWAISPRAYDSFSQLLARNGREVIYYDYILHKKPSRRLNADDSESMIVNSVMDACVNGAAHLVVHSRGAIPAVRQAMQHPEAVKSIVMISPAGMTDISMIKLSSTFFINAFWDLLRSLQDKNQAKRAWSAGVLSLEGVIKNPVHAAAQGLTISKASLNLRDVQKSGIQVGVIASEGDIVFTEENLRRRSKEQGLHDAHFQLVRGRQNRHNNVVITPETYARLTTDFLNSFEHTIQ